MLRSSQKQALADRHPEVGSDVPTRRRRNWRPAVPPSLSRPKKVFVTCHYCAYSPSVIPEDGLCPKCGGYSWQRYALSRQLLAEIGK